MKKAWVLSYPLSAQRWLWSDWADAQADLSLRWAHTHFAGFVMSRLKSSNQGIRAFMVHNVVVMKTAAWACPLTRPNILLIQFFGNQGEVTSGLLIIRVCVYRVSVFWKSLCKGLKKKNALCCFTRSKQDFLAIKGTNLQVNNRLRLHVVHKSNLRNLGVKTSVQARFWNPSRCSRLQIKLKAFKLFKQLYIKGFLKGKNKRISRECHNQRSKHSSGTRRKLKKKQQKKKTKKKKTHKMWTNK